jgi:hypothetical protein
MTYSCLAALTAALLACAATPAAEHIAPSPPDSVLLNGHDAKSDHADMFLSKRTVQELGEFYTASLGNTAGSVSPAKEGETGIVLTRQQVAELLIGRHKDPAAAKDLRVSLHAKPPVPAAADCRGEPFRHLRVLSRLKHRHNEFRLLCQQYGHLQNDYFQRLPNEAHPGRWLAANDVILRAREAQLEQGLTALNDGSEQASQLLSALALAGRADAAEALAADFSATAQAEARRLTDWDAEVEVLKALDAVSYRTLIILPVRPDSW